MVFDERIASFSLLCERVVFFSARFISKYIFRPTRLHSCFNLSTEMATFNFLLSDFILEI